MAFHPIVMLCKYLTFVCYKSDDLIDIFTYLEVIKLKPSNDELSEILIKLLKVQ